MKLLDRVEQFGNLTQWYAPPWSHHVWTAPAGLPCWDSASEMKIIEDYDPSLPMALGDNRSRLQVILNLLKEPP